VYSPRFVIFHAQNFDCRLDDSGTVWASLSRPNLSRIRESEMTVFFWLLVVAGGPILLGCAIAYAMFNNRRLSRRENERRDAATRDLYRSEQK